MLKRNVEHTVSSEFAVCSVDVHCYVLYCVLHLRPLGYCSGDTLIIHLFFYMSILLKSYLYAILAVRRAALPFWHKKTPPVSHKLHGWGLNNSAHGGTLSYILGSGLTCGVHRISKVPLSVCDRWGYHPGFKSLDYVILFLIVVQVQATRFKIRKLESFPLLSLRVLLTKTHSTPLRNWRPSTIHQYWQCRVSILPNYRTQNCR